MEARKLVGWNVRRERAAQGITLEELAGRADASSSYLAQVERGQANIGIDLLGRIAVALNVRLSAFTVEPAAGEKAPRPLPAGRRPKRRPTAKR